MKVKSVDGAMPSSSIDKFKKSWNTHIYFSTLYMQVNRMSGNGILLHS